MSRVAKAPITLPKGVEVSVTDDGVTVKGAKSTLSVKHLPGVDVHVEDGVVKVKVHENGEWKFAGTMRANLNNMVKGVSEGYEKKLELVGVGYRAAMQGKNLNLSLGFSHPVLFTCPDGVSIETPTQTEVLVKGADKQIVGQVAAKIRAFRPPEPYKGKGVRYAGEYIIRKEAKKA